MTAVCFLAAGVLFFRGLPWGSGVAQPPDRDATPASAASPIQPQNASPYLTAKIEDLRVGNWVLADNPELAEGEVERLEAEDIDPATWRTVRLRMTKPDGGRLDIALLRPIEWLEECGGRTGKTVHLELPELGAEGPAEVVSIEPCPTVGPSPAEGCRIVTGTFAHGAANVVDLSIEGLEKSIGTTANHPFWSEDRRAFVPAGELREGETLRTATGDFRRVARIVPRSGPQPVYNLEIDAEHVYYVSDAGVLVHNSYDMHHSIPRGIQKRLPKSVRAHPDVKGRRGLPNRIKITRTKHKEVHDKKGYSANKGDIGGGRYNNRFHEEIQKRGGYDRMTPPKVTGIRDDLVDEFGL